MATPTVSLGHGNPAGIPQLSTYAQAQAHYNSVKPIRGDEEVRPLGSSRRFKWYRIAKKEYIEQMPMYSAALTNLNMVEYYSDGRISITTGGYRSPTSSAFLNFVLMGLGNVVSMNGKWYWKPHRSDNYYYFPIERNFWLHLDELGIPTNPVQEHRYAINRKTMHGLRKTYAPLLEYAKLMLTAEPLIDRKVISELQAYDTVKVLVFRGERFYRWESNEKQKEANRNLASLKYIDEAIEKNDLDMFYNITMLTANSVGKYSYVKETTVCSPKVFKQGFEAFLKDMYWKDVYTRKEHPIGSAFYDCNARFVAHKLVDKVTFRNYVVK